MVVTVEAEATAPDTGRPVRAFLLVRRAPTVLAGAVVSGGLTAALGTWGAALPSAAPTGHSTVPLWRLLAMVVGVLPVMALHSRLADLELPMTRRLRQHQSRYLAGVAVACVAIHLGISAIALPPSVLLIIARSWLAWWERPW